MSPNGVIEPSPVTTTLLSGIGGGFDSAVIRRAPPVKPLLMIGFMIRKGLRETASKQKKIFTKNNIAKTKKGGDFVLPGLILSRY